MKSFTHSLLAGVLLAAGCVRDSSITATNDQRTAGAADEARQKSGSGSKEEQSTVVWKPSSLEGGYMFEGVQQFETYVRAATVVATGIMTEWDGTKGTVRLDSVFHGELNDESVPVIATGGFVRPHVGEKVIFLLAPRDGELRLHSFCGASGMYNYSDELAFVVKNSLKPEG